VQPLLHRPALHPFRPGACAAHTVGGSRCVLQVLALVEDAGIGMSGHNIGDLYNNYTFGSGALRGCVRRCPSTLLHVL
jgi:hypothetical protein